MFVQVAGFALLYLLHVAQSAISVSDFKYVQDVEAVFDEPVAIMLLTVDVVVELDTLTLVESGRLRDDCSDLAFFSKHLLLTSYLETACNEAKTQIWVTLPLSSSGEDYAASASFNIRYGARDELYESNTFMQPFVDANGDPGQFFIFHDDEDVVCGDLGMENFTLLYDKFPVASDIYAVEVDPLPHTHGIDTVSTLPSGVAVSCDASANVIFPKEGHTHDIGTSDVAMDATLPPYRTVSVCSSVRSLPTHLHNNTITLLGDPTPIHNATLPPAPSDYATLHWDRRFDDRHVLVGRNNTPNLEGGSLTHSHAFSVTSAPIVVPANQDDFKDTNVITAAQESIGTVDHVHHQSGVLDPSPELDPAYLQLLMAKVLPGGAVSPSLRAHWVLLTSAVPPKGWRQVSLAPALPGGRLLRGSSDDDAAVLGQTGGAALPTCRHHQHEWDGDYAQEDGTNRGLISKNIPCSYNRAERDHTHGLNILTLSSELAIPTFSLFLIQRNIPAAVLTIGAEVTTMDIRKAWAMGIGIARCAEVITGKRIILGDDIDSVLADEMKHTPKHTAGNDDNGEVTPSLTVRQDLFEIKYDSIRVEKSIGQGGSNSVVFKAKWNGIDVAFKCFRTRDMDSDRFDEFENEVSTMLSISHPNCLQCYGATLQEPRVGIVMEFCGNGDLRAFLTAAEGKETNFEDRLRFIHEITQGLLYLHCRKIIHRDMKCENVLLTKSLQCKIMDFGLAKVVASVSQTKTTRIGTAYYMAPEVIRGEMNYGPECDIYAIGIMMYEVLGMDFDPYAFSEVTSVEFKIAVDPDYRPQIRKIQSELSGNEWLTGLMSECWSHDPAQRPTAEELEKVLAEFRQGGAIPSRHSSGGRGTPPMTQAVSPPQKGAPATPPPAPRPVAPPARPPPAPATMMGRRSGPPASRPPPRAGSATMMGPRGRGGGGRGRGGRGRGRGRAPPPPRGAQRATSFGRAPPPPRGAQRAVSFGGAAMGRGNEPIVPPSKKQWD